MLKDAQGMPELGCQKMLRTYWNQDARGCLNHTRTKMLEDARDTPECQRMLETHGDAGGCSRDTRARMAEDAQGCSRDTGMQEDARGGGSQGGIQGARWSRRCWRHSGARRGWHSPGDTGAGAVTSGPDPAPPPLPHPPHLTHTMWGRTLGGQGDGPHRHTDQGTGMLQAHRAGWGHLGTFGDTHHGVAALTQQAQRGQRWPSW